MSQPPSPSRSARRRIPLALGAMIAVVLGMTALFASNDGAAQAAPDPNQLNISHSTCTATGAYFHFVAPHAEDGTGGELTGYYSLNGGTDVAFSADESLANNSTNAQWDVYLIGSGTFVIKSAMADGGLVYTGNGAEAGTIHCGSTTGSLTVIKTVVGSTLDASHFSLTVTSGGTNVANSPAPGMASPGRSYTGLAAGTYVVGEVDNQGYSVGFSGDCDAHGNVTVVAGATKTCTVTNTFQAQTAATTVTITKECAGLDHVAVQFQVGDHFSALNQDCGATYHTEVTGTSVLINEHLRGTAIASITCNGSGNYVALADAGYTLTLVQNHDNHCTIINHAPAAATTVTVTKECAGLASTAAQFQIGDQYSPVNDPIDCGDTFHATVTGATVVVNEHNRGTAIASITCNGSGNYVALDPAGYTLTLVQNQDNHCTIINHAPATPTTVTVTKECAGMSSTAVLFQIGDVFSPAINCGGHFQQEVTGDTVKINEHLRNAIATITCNGSDYAPLADAGNTITLLQHQDNACTIVNHAFGQLTIVKDFVGTTGLDATFTTTGGLTPATFSLDDDADPALSNSQTFADLIPGVAFTVTEGSMTGWHLSDLSCVADTGSPTGSTLSDTGSTASVMLAAGAHVSCTFTNTENQPQTGTATVTIAKYIHTAAGLVAATDVNTAGASFGMHAVFPGGEGDYALDADGFNGGLPYQATTSPMALGSNYSTFETGIDGTCDAGDHYKLLGYGESSVSLAAASQDLTGDGAFTNLQGNQFVAVINEACPVVAATGQLTIVKDFVGTTGLDATFTTTGGLTPATFSLDDDADPTLSNSQTFSGLSAGVAFTITEGAVTGWHVSDITCVADAGSVSGSTLMDTGNSASVTLAAGAHVTCTFTNTENQPQTGTATVTIAKYIHTAAGLVAATDANTAGASFGMHAVFPGGEGDYALDADGFNGGLPYQATTSPMALGSNYSTFETGIDGTCDAGDHYKLLGYGESSVSLAAASQDLTGDGAFTNLQGNQFVAVINEACPVAGTTPTPTGTTGTNTPTPTPTGTTGTPTPTPTGSAGTTNNTIVNGNTPNSNVPNTSGPNTNVPNSPVNTNQPNVITNTQPPSATLGVIAPPPFIAAPVAPVNAVAGVFAPFVVPGAPSAGNTSASDSNSFNLLFLFGAASLGPGLLVLATRKSRG